MNYSWSDNEIKLLQQYEMLGNEIACLDPNEITDGLMSEFLYLEAKLLVLNKYMIGYLSDVALGIYTFNEALQLEDYYCSKGKIFIFMPIVKEISLL